MNESDATPDPERIPSPEQLERIVSQLLAVREILLDGKDDPLMRMEDAAKLEQILNHCQAALRALGALPDDDDVPPMMPG